MADDQEDAASGWDQWAKQPGNMAALVQFGLQLSQPTPIGQNWMGQVGQALGSAGEAQDRVTKQQLAESENMRRWAETDSRDMLRGAQAENAGMRADMATMRMDAAREKLNATVDSQTENRYLKALELYRKYADNESMFGKKPMTQEAWFKANGIQIPQRLGGGASSGPIAPPQKAIAALREAQTDPEGFRARYGQDPALMMQEFDRRFGAGAASRALGGK